MQNIFVLTCMMQWGGSVGCRWPGCIQANGLGVNLMFPVHHLHHPFLRWVFTGLKVPASAIGRHMQLKLALYPRCHSTSGKVSERFGSHIPATCHLLSVPIMVEPWEKQWAWSTAKTHNPIKSFVAALFLYCIKYAFRVLRFHRPCFTAVSPCKKTITYSI